MKISKHDATEEKSILIGMIVNDVVLGRIATRWRDGGLFRVRWANLVGDWCVGYHRKYGKAPRADIEGLFESWASGATEDDTVDLVERFLGTLSEEYEEENKDINPDYLTDRAAEHFNAVLLGTMTETVKGFVDRGDVPKALETAARWNRVEMGVGAGVDVFQDMEAVQAAFEEAREPLITYPGALGQFFGDQLARDEFVAMLGATGRGKTWWLQDIAWMGIRQGRRVAFFQVGDMSQNQIMRRFMCRSAGIPYKLPEGERLPFDIEVPVAITRESGEEDAEVETETKTFRKLLDAHAAWESCKRFTRRRKKPLLRLSTHPNSSINVAGIVGILDVWEREGWVPDVVVIDYADILAMPALPAGYRAGERDAINETWKQLRSLSQSRHILVVTATQGDAGSYEARTVTRSNFSDDRRKNDHVTAMFGINATETERGAGIYRLNWTKRREAAYIESRCVYVAGNLHVGRPHIRSTF